MFFIVSVSMQSQLCDTNHVKTNPGVATRSEFKKTPTKTSRLFTKEIKYHEFTIKLGYTPTPNSEFKSTVFTTEIRKVCRTIEYLWVPFHKQYKANRKNKYNLNSNMKLPIDMLEWVCSDDTTEILNAVDISINQIFELVRRAWGWNNKKHTLFEKLLDVNNTTLLLQSNVKRRLQYITDPIVRGFNNSVYDQYMKSPFAVDVTFRDYKVISNLYRYFLCTRISQSNVNGYMYLTTILLTLWQFMYQQYKKQSISLHMFAIQKSLMSILYLAGSDLNATEYISNTIIPDLFGKSGI